MGKVPLDICPGEPSGSDPASHVLKRVPKPNNLNLRLRTFFCSNACLRVLWCFLRAFWNLRTFERFAHFSDETPLVAKFGTACVNNRYRAARARAGAAVC